MNLACKLQELRKAKGLKQTEVAAYMQNLDYKVTYGTVSNWERGYRHPSAEQLIELCVLYGVRDVQYEFFGIPSDEDSMAGLNDIGRMRAEEYIGYLLADEQYSNIVRPPVTRTLPLYVLPVSAGPGEFLDSDAYELINVDDTVPLDATFALRINGNSMEPKYRDGQVVYVKQQQDLTEGEIGIFMLNGEAYCKMLREGTLVSLNDSYSPIVISDNDEFRVYGKVLS